MVLPAAWLFLGAGKAQADDACTASGDYCYGTRVLDFYAGCELKKNSNGVWYCKQEWYYAGFGCDKNCEWLYCDCKKCIYDVPIVIGTNPNTGEPIYYCPFTTDPVAKKHQETCTPQNSDPLDDCTKRTGTCCASDVDNGGGGGCDNLNLEDTTGTSRTMFLSISLHFTL